MDLPLTLGDPEISLEQKIDNSLRIGNEHFVNVSSGQFDVDVLLSVCRGIPRKRATFKNRVLNIEEYHWDVHRERLQKISEVENKLVGGNGFTTTCYGYVEKEDSKFHVMRCTEDAIVTLDHVLDTEAQTFKTWCKKYAYDLWRLQRYFTNRGFFIGPLYRGRLSIDHNFNVKLCDFSYVQPLESVDKWKTTNVIQIRKRGSVGADQSIIMQSYISRLFTELFHNPSIGDLMLIDGIENEMDVRQSISVEDFQHIVEGSLSRREGSDLAVQRNNVPVKHMKRRKVCRYCARKHNLSTQISSEEAIKHFILAYFSNCIIRHATGRGELDIREEAKYGKDLISPRMDYNDHEDWLNGVLLKRFLSRQFPMQLQLRLAEIKRIYENAIFYF